MLRFNIEGVSETVQDTSLAGYIRAASTSDLSSVVVFDRTAKKPVEIKTEVLPQNLQNDLTGCDNMDCKYVSYNFDRQVVTEPRSTSNLNHILDLGPIVQIDTGIFLKETEQLPVIFTSLPMYDISYTSYEGTPLETWNNIKGPQVCADRCDAMGGGCVGFNFNQLTFTCTIFPAGTPKIYDGSIQSFTKADIKTTVVPHVYSTPYDFNPDGAGDKCRDADACNSVLSNLIVARNISKFTTNSIKECKYCPVRGFYRIPGSENVILTNEYLNSMQVNDFYNTMFYLQYNKTVISQTGCQPGFHRTSVNGNCEPCGLTLPPNSSYRYLCQYTTCAANQTLTSIWGANASLSRPSFINYCTDSAGPYGHHGVDVTYSWNLTIGGVVYPQTFSKKETLPCAWGQTTVLDTVYPPPVGYKYDSGACTYSSCNGLKWDSSKKIETQIFGNEIYVADAPITRREYANQWGAPGNTLARREYTGDTGAPGTTWTTVDWYSNQNYRVYTEQWGKRGCNASRCPLNSNANADHTQCVACTTALGVRDRRRYSTSCEICSVPLGSTWKAVDRILAGGQITSMDPSDQCDTVACSTLPNDRQIWDSQSFEMCGIRECAVGQVPNADKTACVDAPGVSSICQVHDCTSKCTTGSAISADGKSCVPCNPVNPGYDFAYGAANACYAPNCSNTPLNSNIYDVGCTERTCFASTGPNAGKTACVDCGTEPYISASGQRFGYVSDVAGGSIFGSLEDSTIGGSLLSPGCVALGQCPEPTGLRRWKYDIGCEHVVCPRLPGTNERWAGTFGCDIVTYTGSTVCSVYPRAANKWTNTTSCSITACPTMTTVKTCNEKGWGDLNSTTCYKYKPSTGCPLGSTETTYAGYQICTIPIEVPNSILGPYEIWGPGCTKSSTTRFYQDRINSSKTYPLKCTNFPLAGQQYDGITPCNVVNCQFSPATGYVWDMSNSYKRENGCATKLCTGYTFPNANRKNCIPCPTSAAGWYTTGVLCRVDACSTRVTIAKNQYWTDQYCSYATCPAGFRIVDALRIGAGGAYKFLTCGQCGATPDSQQFWASPGASCDIVTCQGQTKVNAAKNACEPCTPMTPAYGYTFNGVNGCTPAQCPAIGASNVWETAGSCNSSVCGGWSRPNTSQTVCETCTPPAFGYTWVSTVSCNTTACPAIASSNIFTTVGTCDSTSCFTATQPNAEKTDCVACPTLPYGRQWASTSGCATTACPVIASSNIFTSYNSCSNMMCVGLTQPNADKTACEACPTPSFGRQWASNNGCATTACPAIASNNIFPVPGYCFTKECQDNTQPNAGKSACVDCPRPSPGYSYVSTIGCSTQSCTQTPARGYYWDPLGGCTLYQCTNIPGPNQYFTSGCSITTCPTGTLRNPDGISCSDMICDVSSIPLPPKSIYILSATGTCTTTQCSARSGPDASNMVCNPCPTPSLGNTWASADGCTATACSAIASNNIFTTAGSCATTACTGTTVPNAEKSACVQCSGHTQANATNSVCVACTAPSLGYRWASIDGCATNACPGIPSNNIFTTAGDCNLYTACTGHTQANATKTACDACASPGFGYTWASIDGCATNACPGIPSNNIFTTAGSCVSVACANHTQPNATKSVCEACPISPGYTWASTSGCATQACPPIDSNRRYDIYCNSIKCTGDTVPNENKTECIPCGEHSTPNMNMTMLNNSVCVDCPFPSLGNTWAHIDFTPVAGGCSAMSCDLFNNGEQFLFNNEIYASEGLCAYRACTGRTQPDSTRTVCEDCPPMTLAYGWTFEGAPDGCNPLYCPNVPSSNIFLTAGFCDTIACTGHTTPNNDKSACVDCPQLFGRYWSSTEGCATTTCPAIASSNIFTTFASCSNVACTGHTKPNSTKTACIECPITLGKYWTNATGCTTTTCPAIASSNIFTTIGSCSNVACNGHTQPNSGKSACDACPTPSLGNTWASTDGCAVTTCPAISSSNIFTSSGLCANVACTGHMAPDSTKTVCVYRNGDVQWVARISGSARQKPSSIATDSSGLYVTGLYNSPQLTVFNKDGTAYVTTLPGITTEEYTFIVKYSTTGYVQWVARLTNELPKTGFVTTGSGITPYKIATDSSGVYVAGFLDFGGTVKAYNANGTVSKTLGTLAGTMSTYEPFIVKYNTSGTVQWMIRLSGTMLGTYSIGYNVTTDSSGVYLTGLYDAEKFVAYNANGTAYATTLPSATGGYKDGFIVKYNTSGTVQWVARVSGSSYNSDGIQTSTTDSSGLYVAGHYSSNPFMAYNSNGTAYGTTLASSNYDVFIVKYNTSGTVQWLTRLSGANIEVTGPNCMVSDGFNIYITGLTTSTTMTAYNAGGTTAYGTIAGGPLFIVKYNSSGMVQWMTRIAGANIQTAVIDEIESSSSVSVDSSGIYVTGKTNGSIIAYNRDGTPYGTSFSGSGFIVKYNTDGYVQWVNRTSSEISSSATDTSGAYVAGNFINSSFSAYYRDGAAYETTLTFTTKTAAGRYGEPATDSFIVKYY